ncbi:MAG TPA: YdcF family protein [Thermoleophilaceae bacterium]
MLTLIALVAAASLAGLLVALSTTWLRISRAGAVSCTHEADAMVVFGAEVLPSGPCAELMARLRQAAALYFEGRAPLIVCSGGNPGPRSEAQAMSAALRREGVPALAIRTDEQGSCTRRTIADIGQRFGQEQVVLAVSSPYHMHRILLEAGRQGVAMLGAPAPTTPIMRRLGPRLRQQLREVVAIWWYSVSFGPSPEDAPSRAPVGGPRKADNGGALASARVDALGPALARRRVPLDGEDMRLTAELDGLPHVDSHVVDFTPGFDA